ncbi:hypothetical protein [Chryseobacterium sp.]|uniref:hypothetical protein n=1 Tax=Chryseobacterium sp. TaxID=1871047 RepID=UPI0025C54D66|nr:hypothetical protein [Chryseobacterium sp.]
MRIQVIAILLWGLAPFSYAQTCGCPAGSVIVDNLSNLPSSTVTNTTYCVNQTIDFGSNTLTIAPTNSLYIVNGAIIKGTGTFIHQGDLLKICNRSGIILNGAATFGLYGSGKNTTVEMEASSYFSVKGAFSLLDPSFGMPSGKTYFIMKDKSVIEICGTYSSNTISSYPIVEYQGTGKKKALVINESHTVGGGNVLSESDNVIWVTMSQVDDLGPGNALWTGQNATPSSPNWPADVEDGVCGQAMDLSEPDPVMIANPMIHVYH